MSKFYINYRTAFTWAINKKPILLHKIRKVDYTKLRQISGTPFENTQNLDEMPEMLSQDGQK